MNSNLTDNLKKLSAVKLSATSRQRQRDFVLAQIKERQFEPESRWLAWWHVINNYNFIKPLAYVAAVLAMFVTGTFYSMSAMSQSEPGGAWYPVKLRFEQLQVAWEQDSTARAKKQMEFADRRLNELSDLPNETSPVVKQEKVATIVKHFNNSLQEVRANLEKVNTSSEDSAVSGDEVIAVAQLVNTKSSDFAEVLSDHSQDLPVTVQSALQKEVDDIKNYSLELLVDKYDRYRDKISEKSIVEQLQERIISAGEKVSNLSEENQALALDKLSSLQAQLEAGQYRDTLDGLSKFDAWLANLSQLETDEQNVAGEVLGVEEIKGDNLEINLTATTTTSTTTSTPPMLETSKSSLGEEEK